MVTAIMTSQIIPSLKTFGKALRAARHQKGLTQAELGKRIGMKQTTVSNVENGTPGVRLNTIFRLLSGLDLDIVLQSRNQSELDQDDW